MNAQSITTPCIKVVGVHKFKSNSKVDLILHNISFNLERGTITTLIGPNGAGKSTLAKILLGIKKPSMGRCFVAKDLVMGYVPQQIDLRNSMPISVHSFLISIISLSPIRQDVKSICNQYQDFLDVESIKHVQLSHLSGGQMRKLMLLACLLRGSNFIVLDEPTKELDINSQHQFYILLDKLAREAKITIFLVSHDLNLVIKSSHQVLCLNKHLCCYGKPVDSYDDIIAKYNHKHSSYE